MTRRDRTLYRDTDDQQLGGVCAGLARYFDIDTVLVRVAFVAALVLGGGSLIAYVLLWWLLDETPADPVDAATESPEVQQTAPVDERAAA